MKILNVCIANLLALSVLPAYSQDVRTAKDPTSASIKIEELKREKNMLENQIVTEDAKRNQSIAGVAPQTLERLNDKQDSLCLEIRSRLLSVELELSELEPDKTFDIIANQLEKMNGKN